MAVYKIDPKEKNNEEVVKRLRKMTAGVEETMIWSCLEGCMGGIYVDSMTEPLSAQFLIGDFCLFAGEPNRELVAHKPEERESEFVIMTAEESGWFTEIEAVYGKDCKKVTRYAIKKEGDIFDRKNLGELIQKINKIADTSDENKAVTEFTMKPLEEEEYQNIKTNPENGWAIDLISQFSSYEDYRAHGLGMVIKYQDELVSGASSYTWYEGGIEIEIDTKESYRRHGLATICGAALVKKCLEKGLYPSWDAQNLWSVALSEKMGYHFDHEYTAYEVYKF